MPKKKPTSKRKKTRKPPEFSGLLLRVLMGTGVLILLVAAAGVLTHHLLVRKHPGAPAPIESPPEYQPQGQRFPRFEVFPEEDTIDILPPPPPPMTDIRPKVAVIVDDLGYDRHLARRFLELDAELTYAVLPHTPHTRSIAESIRLKGYETILHLPMEPVEYPRVNPGPGALLSSMPPDQLLDQLRRNIDAVPHIKGVNNHMGSKITANSHQMHQIFSVLKRRGLFFIDSRSTAQTLCRPSARLFRLAFAERDVFLDHRLDPAFIRRQIRQLIRIARSKGSAVGIMHPTRTTYEVFQQQLPTLKAQVQLVPASEVVSIPDG